MPANQILQQRHLASPRLALATAQRHRTQRQENTRDVWLHTQDLAAADSARGSENRERRGAQDHGQGHLNYSLSISLSLGEERGVQECK